MDWHLTETGNTSTGWTGYTWNAELFPDPAHFIQQIHELGLKTSLNLHPAEGVHPHESPYAEFARFMGIDPETGQPVPFDPANPHFMQGYFDLLHHPIEEQGVDFWWLDWQQGRKARLPGLDPLWWLNHLHFYDLMRNGTRRPFIFSRWGGLGNHRYPIGFSGDTVVGWQALDFQPGFTAAAANVGYGWWSHDIGGHMGGVEDDELYTRWVQYGVFSPILRLHSTNNPYNERRPWGRGKAANAAAGSAMRLRRTLIPYLYSMAWRNTQTSLPPILPLYYTHPMSEQSYLSPQAYWYGSELVAAPFTQPANPETGLARQVVWLPTSEEGESVWFDFFNGKRIDPGWQIIYGDLDDIPVFARPGAIVPLDTETDRFGTVNPDSLQVRIFPGADNSFELYEDDGETLSYLQGHSLLTPFTQKWEQTCLEFQVGPIQGDLSLVPAGRTYQLDFCGILYPSRIECFLSGKTAAVDHSFNPESNQLTIAPFQLAPGDVFMVRLCSEEGTVIANQSPSLPRLRRFLRAFQLNSYVKQQIERDWPLIASGARPVNSYRRLSDAQVQVLESLLR
jgi:alpha-glucosidase (family GH31 glycosyl hydrolase)